MIFNFLEAFRANQALSVLKPAVMLVFDIVVPGLKTQGATTFQHVADS